MFPIDTLLCSFTHSGPTPLTQHTIHLRPNDTQTQSFTHTLPTGYTPRTLNPQCRRPAHPPSRLLHRSRGWRGRQRGAGKDKGQVGVSSVSGGGRHSGVICSVKCMECSRSRHTRIAHHRTCPYTDVTQLRGVPWGWMQCADKTVHENMNVCHRTE